MKQIKYFAVNEEIETQIKSIRRAIYLSMNGICAENIDNSGLEYKQNFGVAWSRLVEIAQNYTPDFFFFFNSRVYFVRPNLFNKTIIIKKSLFLTFFTPPLYWHS